MSKNINSPRKTNARMVAKLKARYKGAGRRVETLNTSIAELSTTIRNRYKLREVKRLLQITRPSFVISVARTEVQLVKRLRKKFLTSLRNFWRRLQLLVIVRKFSL